MEKYIFSKLLMYEPKSPVFSPDTLPNQTNTASKGYIFAVWAGVREVATFCTPAHTAGEDVAFARRVNKTGLLRSLREISDYSSHLPYYHVYHRRCP